MSHTVSPFQRLIAVDYYDGPIAGLLECAQCKKVFRFEKIDWDDDQSIRIFSLADVPMDSLSGFSWPQKPIASHTTWILDPDRDKDIVITVAECLRAARPPSFVVAAYDLLDVMLAMRTVESVHGIDWFGEMNLSRQSGDRSR